MKKILATAAAAVLAAATLSAGEGLKVSGFIRNGLSGDISDMVSGADGKAISNTWVAGDYWGGPSRARFQAVYDGDNGGVEFRLQPNKLASADYFANENVKWLMAYAKFFDGAIEVEGGKLHDRYTDAGGWEGYSFQATGVRLVLHPIDSLYITIQGSDYNPAYYYYEDATLDDKEKRRQNKIKFDTSLLSATAKFSTDSFFVTGGAHFSGIFYGSFGYTGVENLTFVAEAKADYAKHYNFKDENGDAYGKDAYGNTSRKSDDDSTHYLVTDVNLEYDADPVLFGVAAYVWVADDAYFYANDPWVSTVIPAIQFKLSDITALRVESSLFLPKDWDEKKYGSKKDMYTTVTPSVVFNASKKAEVNVWLTISSKTEEGYAHHATGVGVKYAF